MDVASMYVYSNACNQLTLSVKENERKKENGRNEKMNDTIAWC